jgi:uncharacterized protein (TIGR02757 family)
MISIHGKNPSTNSSKAKKVSASELQDILEVHFNKHNQISFIENDPIQIPHRFKKREDIEIAAFLTSTIAWGNRKSIINNAARLMNLMDWSPHDFIINSGNKDLRVFNGFVHRTFNSDDCIFFIRSLKEIYRSHGGLKMLFEDSFALTQNIRDTLISFRQTFLSIPHDKHSQKHLSDLKKNSAAKRLNLFLMWLCRKDDHGVHFGLWNIPSSALYIPLDVHCGNVGRSLGLLTRNQNDWKAVEELTASLRRFDPLDPVKYDFALFGMGVSGTLDND